jgi:hypothetical protein
VLKVRGPGADAPEMVVDEHGDRSDAGAAWDAELDDFEARLDAVEASLASGGWEIAKPWVPPVHLETAKPDAAQLERLRALTARGDAARDALRHGLAEVARQMGSRRQQTSAARQYLRAEVHR